MPDRCLCITWFYQQHFKAHLCDQCDVWVHRTEWESELQEAAFELTVSDLQKNSPNAQKKLKKALQLFEGFLSTGINGNVSQGMTLKTLDFLMENLEFSQKLTKTLAEICLFVNEDFSRDDISKGHKHLQQVLVSELLGQVVDEQVGTFWTCKPSRH